MLSPAPPVHGASPSIPSASSELHQDFPLSDEPFPLSANPAGLFGGSARASSRIRAGTPPLRPQLAGKVGGEAGPESRL